MLQRSTYTTMKDPGPYRTIADGVYQVKIPLPYALRIVNCYLLRGQEGWTVLDTGLNRDEARRAWLAALDALQIDPATIEQIVVTHAHPDHFGMAGWFQQLCGKRRAAPPVRMSIREMRQARTIWMQPDRDGTRRSLAAYLTACGVPDGIPQTAISLVEQTRDQTLPHPTKMETLTPGTNVRMGERRFQVIEVAGHSDGQLIFYDPDDRLMLCADHVLIKITPNIGLWPTSDPDPLGRYLATLSALKALDVRLAAPGHGPLIHDWAGRLMELEQHHVERLARLYAAADGGATVYAVCAAEFDLPHLTPHEVRFALAETLAHLEYLVERKQLAREANGIWRYYHP